MKKTPILLGIGLATALTSACFYESPVPIAAPSSELAFDSTIVGHWRSINRDAGDTATITIERFDQTYHMVHFSDPEKDYTWLDGRLHIYFRAHPTLIGGVRFLNLQALGRDETLFLIFRYERTGDVLRIRALKEKMAVGLNTSPKLLAFLQLNLTNDSIYDTWMELKRVVEPGKTSTGMD